MDRIIYTNNKELLHSEVGNLLEIKKVLPKFQRCAISMSPEFLFSEDLKEVRALITLNNARKSVTGSSNYDKMNIIGINPAFNKITKKLEFCSVSTNDMEMFFSLIRLVHEPIYWDKLSDSFINDEIINWCEKYSMPTCKEDDIFKVYDGAKFRVLYIDMPLYVFLEGTAELYLLFYLWRSMITDDLDSSRKYYSKLTELLHEDYTRKLDDINEYNCLLSSFINFRVEEKIHTKFMNFGKSKIYLDADDLFGMCYFMLANMITKPGESTLHLKNCNNCGTLFWGHGNKDYCDNCNRKTIWARHNKKDDSISKIKNLLNQWGYREIITPEQKKSMLSAGMKLLNEGYDYQKVKEKLQELKQLYNKE